MMFRKFAKKQLHLTKKPLDLLYRSKKIKKFVDKSVIPLNIIYREKRLITFLFGNHLVFLSGLLITWTLTEVFHVWHMFSYGSSLVLGMIFAYFFHHYITFELTKNSHRRISMFMIITSVNYACSWILVYLITKFFHGHYILTIIVVSIPLSLMYYKLNRKFVFKV